jgi:hypothetical protein
VRGAISDGRPYRDRQLPNSFPSRRYTAHNANGKQTHRRAERETGLLSSRYTTAGASSGRTGSIRVQAALSTEDQSFLVRKGSSQDLGRQSDPADLLE